MRRPHDAGGGGGRQPGERAPMRAAVARIPDPAVGRRRVQPLALRVNRERIDAPADARESRVRLQHDLRAERDPQIRARTRRGAAGGCRCARRSRPAARCDGREMPAVAVAASPASERQCAPPSPEYQTPPFADAAYSRSPSGCTASALTRPVMRGEPAFVCTTTCGPSGIHRFVRESAGARLPGSVEGPPRDAARAPSASNSCRRRAMKRCLPVESSSLRAPARPDVGQS